MFGSLTPNKKLLKITRNYYLMIIYLLFEFDIPSAVDIVHEKSNAFFILNTNVLT